MAARMINLEDLWAKIFPKENPFFEKEGKKWCRYDEVRVQLPVAKFLDKPSPIEVQFRYQGQTLFFLELRAMPGDTLHLTDIQGIAEVKICEC